MAYTLYWWHPQRGVKHMTWDRADQVGTHIESIQNFERNWGDWPLEYYSYDTSFGTWWYYCKPQPIDPKTATAMQSRAQDPWQRRTIEGIPKQIRAYHLLLG